MVSVAREGMHKFLPRLNRLLTGNGYRRNPFSLPVVITALHGQRNNYDKGRTLHYHLAVGNYDRTRVEQNGFETALMQHWCETGIGTTDVLVESIYDTDGWAKYIGREMLDGNCDSIDLDTTQIPAHLLGV
jgi:hypothetical protein